MTGDAAAWPVDRFYDLAGHLHCKLRDRPTGSAKELHAGLKRLRGSVSPTLDPNLAVPGYAVENEFCGIRCRGPDGPPIRRWLDFALTVPHACGEEITRCPDPHGQPPSANLDFRFVEPG